MLPGGEGHVGGTATEVFARIFEMLALDADNEFMMLDATIVQAHQHSAPAQKKMARTKPSGARAAG